MKCSRCGAKPLPDTQAVAGGHHYRKIVRYDASKRGAPLTVMRRCGVWVAA